MALVADSFHMLSDIAALVIAFISVKMAPKSWSKVRCCWFNLSSESISFHLPALHFATFDEVTEYRCLVINSLYLMK